MKFSSQMGKGSPYRQFIYFDLLIKSKGYNSGIYFAFLLKLIIGLDTFNLTRNLFSDVI